MTHSSSSESWVYLLFRFGGNSFNLGGFEKISDIIIVKSRLEMTGSEIEAKNLLGSSVSLVSDFCNLASKLMTVSN